MASGCSEVITTRPFQSVREAVAVFGERILAGDLYSPKKPIYAAFSPPPSPPPPPPFSSSSRFDQDGEDELIMTSLKKLEAELEETKRELKLLKERESATEVAVATLNAELHKSMSKLAEMEMAGVAAKMARSRRVMAEQGGVRSHRWGEEMVDDSAMRFDYLPSLSQAMSRSMVEGELAGKKKANVLKKKKPIVPLVGHRFSRKKSSGDLNFSDHYSRPLHSILN